MTKTGNYEVWKVNEQGHEEYIDSRHTLNGAQALISILTKSVVTRAFAYRIYLHLELETIN